MAKGIFGGMTDYSHQSFSDILKDLNEEKLRTEEFVQAIKSNISMLEANSYWATDVHVLFKNIISYALRHYNTAIEEFDDISRDLIIEVQEHHVKRLENIATVASEINISIGQLWNGDNFYQDYGNNNFTIVERIYAQTRDMAVNLLDTENIAQRLKHFIGRKTEPKAANDPQPKKESKWGLGQKLSLISIIIALIVLFFGNNIYNRISEEKIKSSKDSQNKDRAVKEQNKKAKRKPDTPKTFIQLAQFGLDPSNKIFTESEPDSFYPFGDITQNPIFSVTFLNTSDKAVILTDIYITPLEFQILQGDAPPSGNSEVIPALHKYIINLPALDGEDYYKYPNKKLRKFKKEHKSAIPPINIRPGAPARVKLELVSHNESVGYTLLLLEFKFSNNESVTKKFSIDF